MRWPLSQLTKVRHGILSNSLWFRKVWAEAAAEIIAPPQLIPAATDGHPVQRLLSQQAAVLAAIRTAHPHSVLVSELCTGHIPVWPVWSSCSTAGSRFLAAPGPNDDLLVLDCQQGMGVQVASSLPGQTHDGAAHARPASSRVLWEWLGQADLLMHKRPPSSTEVQQPGQVSTALLGDLENFISRPADAAPAWLIGSNQTSGVFISRVSEPFSSSPRLLGIGIEGLIQLSCRLDGTLQQPMFPTAHLPKSLLSK